ncbi:MAG: hypothetical protein JWM80_2365 [Cyanobacteria bacterium RYN_339]|nr:hypothetical protein [Cyanobacteria bacterium RYN_339]
MSERIESYEAFWPYYVAEHRNVTCRRLHFVGTTLVYGCLVAGVVANPWFLAGAPLAGYGFAWLGHFGFEKNRPATFQYPLWSLRADFRMYYYTLLGRMPGEIARANELYPV